MKIMIYLTLVFVLSNMAMAQIYDTTNLTNASNLYEYTYETNVLVDYFIGEGILLIMFVLPFIIITGKGYSSFDGAILSSFITLITAIIFLPLGLITMDIFQTTLLICAAFIASMFFLGK